MSHELSSYWDYRDIREYLKRQARAEWPPLMITVAPTGGVHGKEMNPNLPESPEEQVEETYAAYQAGASIVHVHARLKDTGYADVSSSSEDYRHVNALIREKCPDMIINNTTGGGYGMPLEQRIKSLDALPEMASLNLGPLPVKFTLRKRSPPLTGRPEDVDLDVTDPEMPHPWQETELLAKTMLQKGIKPELEMYNDGQLWLVHNLVDKGLLKQPYFIQLVLGTSGGTYSTPKTAMFMVDLLPQPCLVNVAGMGGAQLTVNTVGIIMGWHIRTGMEDNVYYKRGEKAKTNADLVARIVRIAKEVNREIATPSQAREMLGISKTPRGYN